MELQRNCNVNYTLERLNETDGLMNPHRYTTPTHVRKIISALRIVSRLSHYRLIWATATKHNKEQILIAQKLVNRVTPNIPWNTHASEYFNKFSMIWVNSLCNFRLSSMSPGRRLNK